MRLPKPLVRARSATAQGLAYFLRAFQPLTTRCARFMFEVWARSQIRGKVEPGVQFIGSVTVEGTGNVHIGEGTRIGRRVFFETHGEGVVRIGRNCTINTGVTIVSRAAVTVGDYALIGEYTSVRDGDHATQINEPIRFQPHVAKPITIGNDAWLGRGVCVLKGVTVGDGAIIGANSVVTRDVEPRTVAVGAPAKEIGVRSS